MDHTYIQPVANRDLPWNVAYGPSRLSTPMLLGTPFNYPGMNNLQLTPQAAGRSFPNFWGIQNAYFILPPMEHHVLFQRPNDFAS